MQRFILEQNLQRYRRRLPAEADVPTCELLRRLIADCERDLALLDAEAWGALPATPAGGSAAGFKANFGGSAAGGFKPNFGGSAAGFKPNFDGSAAGFNANFAGGFDARIAGGFGGGLEGALDGRGIARALDACADPALLIDPGPGLHIIDLNQAFCDAAMVEPGRAVSERLFVVFPENPDDPGADGVVKLYASLRRVAATGEPHALPEQRYDMRDRDGRFVERRWRMQISPIFSRGGRLLYLLHQVEDVTALAAAAACGAIEGRSAVS